MAVTDEALQQLIQDSAPLAEAWAHHHGGVLTAEVKLAALLIYANQRGGLGTGRKAGIVVNMAGTSLTLETRDQLEARLRTKFLRQFQYAQGKEGLPHEPHDPAPPYGEGTPAGGQHPEGQAVQPV